jgi:23S rRNA (cytidine2498-2'-O)-methyltransferase
MRRKPQRGRHPERKREQPAGRKRKGPGERERAHDGARKPLPRKPLRPGRPARAAEPAVVRGLDARSFELAASALQAVRRARAGEWLWTTRPGSERDLCEELALWRADSRPQLVAPALVASHGAPLRQDGPPPIAFARQGFPISAVLEAESGAALLAPLLAALAPALPGASAAVLDPAREEPDGYGLHVWVPDADSSNPLAPSAASLRVELAAALARELGQRPREQLPAHLPQDVPLAQVCLASEQLAYAGVLPLGRALSLAPGGRERMRVQADRPSRSARKLEEALAWAGIAPGRGETCIDLGAAPGGWTWIARRRGARVIAVDPALLRPDVAADSGVRHLRASAFGYEPEQPVDWLLCDMAWRPLEVAALLARYARRHDARFLIANFKLPMKRKAEMVARLCEVLQSAGWQALRCRQLYHDRDEVTVFART